jgi:hypothetical protein
MAKADPHVTSSGWDRRGLLLAVGAVELSLAVLAYAGTSSLAVFYQLIIDGALLLAWLLAAAGWGAMLLTPLRRFDPQAISVSLQFVTAAALGLGFESLLTLGLGLAGWLNRGVAIAVVVGGLACAAAQVWRRWGGVLQGDLDRPLRDWLREPAGWNWLWLAALPLLAVALVAACVPPGMLWTPDEPHGYDVVEYHLQIPREWYEAGRILPLEHNVFSYFPFGVEMHYLLAMHLRGGPWKGMYLAQLMHVAHVALTVVAVYGLAFSLTQRRATAVIAALVVTSAPWLTLLAPIAYNEGGLLLYGTLAIGWSLRALDAPPRTALVRFTLAGGMAGFACGVKLTAVPMLLAGVPLVILLVIRRQFRGALIFGLVGLALFSPWLIRNWVWAGNPVFPEAMPLLGRAHFSGEQAERWQRAHSARPDQKPVYARLVAAGREILINWRFGFVLFPLAVIAVRPRDRRSRVLGGLLLLLLLFWLALTHLQGRFFVLGVPIAALIIALADWGRWTTTVAAVAAVSALASWLMVHRPFADRLYNARWVQVLGAYPEALSGLNPPEVASVPPDATLVLVGDARAFWFQRPMKLLRYRTVFDVDAPAGTDVVQAWRGDGPRSSNEWLLIDPQELRRFHRTYQGIPDVPPDWEDRTAPLLIPPSR